MNKSDMTKAEMLRKRFSQLAKYNDTGAGRSLEELKKSTGVLKGQESARLRTFCSNTRMNPGEHLDAFGELIMQGSLQLVLMDNQVRLTEKPKDLSMEAKKMAVAEDYDKIRWGPTSVPIYNLLGLLSQIIPPLRKEYLSIAKFFIAFGVPVRGTDLSGTTALSHCFSTKPSFDLEYAQMLSDAGGDVNNRNRYGGIVAHEIVQVYDPSDPVIVDKATKSLQWFLEHGGSVDIADGDGMTPRFMIERLKKAIPAFSALVRKEDVKRKLKGSLCCSLCGRDEGKLLACSKCKKAKYCSPQVRGCQKWDWPKHKKECQS
ncbi:hypothetical protein B0H34DRAFT_734747 [Crassisporium funariophilum]|nr:hypothetical protein B0H34DRAFT_734747 [Crassisporium funariophilum]